MDRTHDRARRSAKPPLDDCVSLEIGGAIDAGRAGALLAALSARHASDAWTRAPIADPACLLAALGRAAREGRSLLVVLGPEAVAAAAREARHGPLPRKAAMLAAARAAAAPLEEAAIPHIWRAADRSGGTGETLRAFDGVRGGHFYRAAPDTPLAVPVWALGQMPFALASDMAKLVKAGTGPVSLDPAVAQSLRPEIPVGGNVVQLVRPRDRR